MKTNSSKAGAEAEKQRLEQQEREEKRSEGEKHSTTEKEPNPATTKHEGGFEKR